LVDIRPQKGETRPRSSRGARRDWIKRTFVARQIRPEILVALSVNLLIVLTAATIAGFLGGRPLPDEN